MSKSSWRRAHETGRRGEVDTGKVERLLDRCGELRREPGCLSRRLHVKTFVAWRGWNHTVGRAISLRAFGDAW